MFFPDIVPVTNLPAAGEETWGMIYFAESYVLQDPETSTASSLAEVLNTIAHEIVHQVLYFLDGFYAIYLYSKINYDSYV